MSPAPDADLRALVVDAIEALERIGCEFQFCDGPTLEPVPMVTCFVCDLLARLRQSVGQPPRQDDKLTFDERNRERDRREMARATGRPALQRDQRGDRG